MIVYITVRRTLSEVGNVGGEVACSLRRAASWLTVLGFAASTPACATGDSGGPSGDDGGATGSSANSGGSGSLGAGSGSVSTAGGSGTFGGSGSANAGSAGGAVESSGATFASTGVPSGGDDDAGSESANGADATEADLASDATATESGNPPSTGLSVLYQVGIAAPMSAYLGCELSIQNSGTGSPAVSSLKVRYYFTDEVRLSEQMTINWSHISTSGADADSTVTYTFAPLVPPTPDADTYIEFSFSSSHTLLAAGESVEFSWQLQGPDPAKDIYTQTNDYSFDASKTALTSWDHVVLLQNGSVAWGTEP
jgi:hypothetical protein